MKFPIVFRKKLKRIEKYSLLFLEKSIQTLGHKPYFFMTDETKNTDIQVPDLTNTEEVRKAIIANEILTRKY